jgi:Uncharacterised protein family (UPF0182)
MLATRELNVDKLPESSRNWINEKLVYTHGYGITRNPVNGFTPEGLPTLVTWRKIAISLVLPAARPARAFSFATCPRSKETLLAHFSEQPTHLGLSPTRFLFRPLLESQQLFQCQTYHVGLSRSREYRAMFIASVWRGPVSACKPPESRL